MNFFPCSRSGHDQSCLNSVHWCMTGGPSPAWYWYLYSKWKFFINFKIYFEAIYLMYVLPKWFLAFLDKIWIVHTKYFEMFDNHVWKHTVLKLYINSWNHICNWQDEEKDAKKEQQGVATSGLSLNKKIFRSPILLTAFWTQRKFWFIGYCINMMYQ